MTEAFRRAGVRRLVVDSETQGKPTTLPVSLWSAFTAFVTHSDLAREARRELAAEQVKLHPTF